LDGITTVRSWVGQGEEDFPQSKEVSKNSLKMKISRTKKRRKCAQLVSPFVENME
jgi:hypothetical protein